MENYFNYFTEIEERFCRRRGTLLQVSTLDWALMEMWKEAGVPLEAVLRGIDQTFDKYDSRPQKTRKINGLAYCTQQVLTAAEDMKEAAVGASRSQPSEVAGMDRAEIAAFFTANAQRLQGLDGTSEFKKVVFDCGQALNEMVSKLNGSAGPEGLEDLERRLTVLEEKILAALTISTPEEELVAFRADADREIAPYRSKMPSSQIEQLLKQFVHKRLFEKNKVPRLSLFYLWT